MMTKMYVILPYSHYEGCGAPLKGYFDMERASIMVEHLNNWIREQPVYLDDGDEEWKAFEAEYAAWIESCPIKVEYLPSCADSFTYVEVEVE
jgi:hypothetical protein